MKLTYKIPIVFHTLRGYDSHMLMQEIEKFDKKINIIPNNMEKYMSFSVQSEYNYVDNEKIITENNFNLTFIDSLQFLASSLGELISNLKSGGMDKFKYLSEEFEKETKY